MSERNVTVRPDTDQGKIFAGIGGTAMLFAFGEILKEIVTDRFVKNYAIDYSMVRLGCVVIALGIFLLLLALFIVTRKEITAGAGRLDCSRGSFSVPEIEYIKVSMLGTVRICTGGKLRYLCDTDFIGCGELLMWAEESGIEVRDRKSVRKDMLFLMKVVSLAAMFILMFRMFADL